MATKAHRNKFNQPKSLKVISRKRKKIVPRDPSDVVRKEPGKPAYVQVHHGTGTRLRPKTALKPSSDYNRKIKTLRRLNPGRVANVAKGKQKRVYASADKEGARYFAGHHYEKRRLIPYGATIPTRKKGYVHTARASMGNPKKKPRWIGGEESNELVTRRPVRSTHVHEVHSTGLQSTERLSKSDTAIRVGHSYANKAKTLSNGKKSKIAYANLPKHTSEARHTISVGMHKIKHANTKIPLLHRV